MRLKIAEVDAITGGDRLEIDKDIPKHDVSTPERSKVLLTYSF
jgi:hypothetical protein